MTALRKTLSPSAASQNTGAGVKKPQKTMSIGVVLQRLREEFPDIAVSKIRFLETEGLVSPQRTAAGYRRFTEQDVERLRYVLITQRDNYLPLKVIREQLEAMDSGQVTAILTAADASPIVSPDNFRAPTLTHLTDTEVAQQAKVDDALVADFISTGLIAPDGAGYFTADDVKIVRTAVALQEFGFDLRHLKSLKATANRQADLISQVTQPIAKSGRENAVQKAEDIGQQMSALVVSLHASLVKNQLRNGFA